MEPLPDPDAYPRDPPSLADRVAASLRRGALRSPRATRSAMATDPGQSPYRADGFAIALALLLPAGPLLAWGVAAARTDAIRAEVAASEPMRARAAAGDADRAALAAIDAVPRPSAWLNALARALPPDARVASVGVDPGGVASAEVTTADPDRLRDGLRRDPLTARLRDAGQRRGEGGIVVELRTGPR